MANQWYSKAHYQRLSNGAPDTADIIANRIKRAKACKQANEEMMAKFGPLTPENAQAAIDWQESRINQLTKEL